MGSRCVDILLEEKKIFLKYFEFQKVEKKAID